MIYLKSALFSNYISSFVEFLPRPAFNKWFPPQPPELQVFFSHTQIVFSLKCMVGKSLSCNKNGCLSTRIGSYWYANYVCKFLFHESHSNNTFEAFMQRWLNPAKKHQWSHFHGFSSGQSLGICNLSCALKPFSFCTLFQLILSLSTSILIKQALFKKCFCSHWSSI